MDLVDYKEPDKSFDFSKLTHIQDLKIQKSKFYEAEWHALFTGLVSIPSKSFRKFVLETESVEITNLEELSKGLETVKGYLMAEIRCAKIVLRLSLIDKKSTEFPLLSGYQNYY